MSFFVLHLEESESRAPHLWYYHSRLPVHLSASRSLLAFPFFSKEQEKFGKENEWDKKRKESQQNRRRQIKGKRAEKGPILSAGLLCCSVCEKLTATKVHGGQGVHDCIVEGRKAITVSEREAACRLELHGSQIMCCRDCCILTHHHSRNFCRFRFRVHRPKNWGDPPDLNAPSLALTPWKAP